MKSHHIEAVRRFNRFYTREIGVLREGLLDSPFSLTEARVLYELTDREKVTAAELGNDLGLDRGYLSRILQRFERQGLIKKSKSQKDQRQSFLMITPKGRKVYAPVNERAQKEVAQMLSKLPPVEQHKLLEAMETIQGLIRKTPEPKVPYLIRSHHSGDLGWIVHRHAVLFSQEYGWDDTFEALVARIASNFINHFDPKREHCWIAERDGEIVGSLLLTKKSKSIAQLQLLLVEPKARGLGIGKRLLEECVRFTRQKRYVKIALRTYSVCKAARQLYEQVGFRLVHEQPQQSFGRDLIEQNWELKL